MVGAGAGASGVPFVGVGVAEGALIEDFELGLMDVVGGEGDGAGEGLGDEPEVVVATIDGVDAADEDAGEEEAHDADEDVGGAFVLAVDGVAEAWDDAGGDAFGGVESLAVVGHGVLLRGWVWCGVGRVFGVEGGGGVG